MLLLLWSSTTGTTSTTISSNSNTSRNRRVDIEVSSIRRRTTFQNDAVARAMVIARGALGG